MVKNSRLYAINLYIKYFQESKAINNPFCKRGIKHPRMTFVWHIIKAFFF
jgi:hypothetical protein